MRANVALAGLCVSLLHAAVSSAQLTSAKAGPVVYGHHHVNATRVAAHTAFFADGLGGVLVTVGGP